VRPVSFPLTDARGGHVRRPSRLLVGGIKWWVTGMQSPASRRWRACGGEAVAREGRPRVEKTMAEVLDEWRWKGEREGGRLEREEEKEQMGEDKNIQGDFCKYLPLW